MQVIILKIKNQDSLHNCEFMYKFPCHASAQNSHSKSQTTTTFWPFIMWLPGTSLTSSPTSVSPTLSIPGTVTSTSDTFLSQYYCTSCPLSPSPSIPLPLPRYPQDSFSLISFRYLTFMTLILHQLLLLTTLFKIPFSPLPSCVTCVNTAAMNMSMQLSL